MKKKLMIFIAVIALAFGTVNAADKYEIIPGSSKIMWIGEKVLGKHWGTVEIKEGTLSMDGSGKFVIDMTSINVQDIQDDEINAKLVGHLKSADFFNVPEHKESHFVIKSMKEKKQGKFNHEIKGDLTIKGITHEITFPANVNVNNGRFFATAEITIDRSKWDIRYGSGSFFDGLGDKMIYDEVKFELELIGKKA